MDSDRLKEITMLAKKHGVTLNKEEAVFLYGYVEQQVNLGLKEIDKQIDSLEIDESF